LDGQLGWLPADVKAALLAVARYAQHPFCHVLGNLLHLPGCTMLYILVSLCMW
jgi:hypothetical protein